MTNPPDILAEADALLAAGRYRVARRVLTAGGMPLDAAGLGRLGAALIGLNDHRAAHDCLTAALALTPDDPALRFDLARALNGLGQMHAAVPILADLHSAAPLDTAITEALANALRRDARYEDAIALVDAEEAAGRLTPAILYHRALSRHYLSDGAGALGDFDRLLADDPDHAAAWFASHACVLGDQGLEAALDRLRRAAACTGANRKYAAFLAAYHVLTGASIAQPEGGDKAAILDGARALVPHLAPDCRLFGLSADILRHGLAAATLPGLVLEFGVRRGTSLRHIAAVAGQHCHGFDSFEGLPEGWGNELAGTFSLGSENADLPPMPTNVTLHKGWFEDSLPPFLADHPGPVRFVNVDCDIYSSTVTVLTALADRLVPGSVLVFDEFIGNRTWVEHEFKAFAEFTARMGRPYRIIGVSPFTGQVAIRLE